MKTRLNNTKIVALRNVVQWNREDAQMPDPEELLNEAQNVPQAPRVLCASDYGEVIHKFRSKGYTWNEITKWLNEKGAKYSVQAIVSGWRSWQRRQPES